LQPFSVLSLSAMIPFTLATVRAVRIFRSFTSPEVRSMPRNQKRIPLFCLSVQESRLVAIFFGQKTPPSGREMDNKHLTFLPVDFHPAGLRNAGVLLERSPSTSLCSFLFQVPDLIIASPV
jgi:hypothetical protein